MLCTHPLPEPSTSSGDTNLPAFPVRSMPGLHSPALLRFTAARLLPHRPPICCDTPRFGCGVTIQDVGSSGTPRPSHATFLNYNTVALPRWLCASNKPMVAQTKCFSQARMPTEHCPSAAPHQCCIPQSPVPYAFTIWVKLGQRLDPTGPRLPSHAPQGSAQRSHRFPALQSCKTKFHNS